MEIMRMGQWISARDLAAGSRLRLFCLPHAGSGSAAFYRWKRLLPEWIDVCPVFLPGREVRLGEAPLTQANELAKALTDAVEPYLDKPYAIFGHSMGALLAFELAHRLGERGLGEPQWLFLSGRVSARLLPPHRGLHALGEVDLLEELGNRYGALPQTLLNDPELLELFLPILRADLSVVESYQYRERGVLQCPLSVYAGVDDGSIGEAGLAAWRSETVGPFEVRRFAGDHFYHLGPAGLDLVGAIGGALSSAAILKEDSLRG